MKKIKILVALTIILFASTGCSSDNTTKKVDKLRLEIEGSFKGEHGTTMQTIKFKDGTLFTDSKFFPNDGELESFGYAIDIDMLDFETMKSNSSVIQNEIWIDCKNNSPCLLHTYEGRKFAHTTIKIKNKNPIDVINMIGNLQ
ncbi:MAG: hypothetical protein OQL08_02395 [Gammaproteobacteria bacterium]|nr:hypothetical protein [Gammaproteobacteria bacterium]